MGRDLLLLDLMVVILHKKCMLWFKKKKIAVLMCIICNGIIYIEKLLHTFRTVRVLHQRINVVNMLYEILNDTHKHTDIYQTYMINSVHIFVV
jgi:hypothetical protein